MHHFPGSCTFVRWRMQSERLKLMVHLLCSICVAIVVLLNPKLSNTNVAVSASNVCTVHLTVKSSTGRKVMLKNVKRLLQS